MGWVHCIEHMFVPYLDVRGARWNSIIYLSISVVLPLVLWRCNESTCVFSIQGLSAPVTFIRALWGIFPLPTSGLADRPSARPQILKVPLNVFCVHFFAALICSRRAFAQNHPSALRYSWLNLGRCYWTLRWGHSRQGYSLTQLSAEISQQNAFEYLWKFMYTRWLAPQKITSILYKIHGAKKSVLFCGTLNSASKM